MTLTDIERLTEDYAAARIALNDCVSELQEAIAAANKQHLPALRQAVADVADRHLALNNAIAAHPALFDSPRTQSWHGVKVGLQKGVGGMEWDDEEDVVARIEKRFGDDAQTYLKVTKRPIKTALAQLDVKTLKTLGCTVTETGDRVVIKASDTAVDKIVRALLKGAVDDAQAPSEEREAA